MTGYKQELKSVNELLLIAVEQKFKLQQQNLEWEVIGMLIGLRHVGILLYTKQYSVTETLESSIIIYMHE